MRTNLATTRPGLGTSIGFWVSAFAVDVLVPQIARGVDLTRCMDGYTDLNSTRVALSFFVVVPTLLALWRAVRHLRDDPSPRWKVGIAAVMIALVAGAIGAILAMSAILEAGVPTKITIGGGC